MNENKKFDQALTGKHEQKLLNILMVSVMLTCFAVIIGKSIQLIYPIWGSYWFPILTFLITVISLHVRQAQRATPKTFQNQTLFILAEIILLMLITKAISMFTLVFMGYTTIWLEIASWPQDFFQNFFNMDFLFRASAILIIWLLTWLFSAPINKLEEDQALMEQEKLGYTFTDRYDARRKLISLIFNLGILMILVMVLWQSNLPFFDEDLISTGILVLVLLIYFFTAFIFLALNQYAIMKARWFFNDIDVNPNLGKRWLFYSLFFIFIVILLIAFLPTNLPLGISTIAEWLSQAFIYLLSTLFSILTFPIFLILALINQLFGRETIDQTFQPSEPSTDILPQTVAATPWLDVVRSVLFWVVFLVIVISAIIYYFNNRPEFKNFLIELRLISLIRDFWHWLLRGFKEAKDLTSESIQSGFGKIQSFLRNQKKKFPTLFDFVKRLPPRQAVILIYADWIQWNKQHGFERKISQTPNEYAQAFTGRTPEEADLNEEISDLTKIFIQARYSRDPIFKAQAQEAQNLSKLLKKSLSLQNIPQNIKESKP